MKSYSKIFTMMILAAAGTLTLSAAPKTASPEKAKEIPKSVFTLPTGPQEGRDPFFPDSQRPYISNPAKSTVAPSLGELTIKSILPSGNRAFAIINNHTFAPGDDGVVTLKDGRRLTIHCSDINVAAGTVTVEASGATAILHFNP